MLELMKKICKAEDIMLRGGLDIGEIRGIAFKDPTNGFRAIGYNSNLTGIELLSVIAHEIGHHVLGHFEGDELNMDSRVNKNNSRTVEKKEREAEIFSATFTALVMFVKYADSEVIT